MRIKLVGLSSGFFEGKGDHAYLELCRGSEMQERLYCWGYYHHYSHYHHCYRNYYKHHSLIFSRSFDTDTIDVLGRRVIHCMSLCLAQTDV